MKKTVFMAPIVLAVMSLALTSHLAMGGESRKSPPGRGGQIASQENEKRSSGAQWFADPVRGWVRSDDLSGEGEKGRNKKKDFNDRKSGGRNKFDKR